MKNPAPTPLRLAIVVSHPIQYYAPWFAWLTRHLAARIRVFYLWDFGVRPQTDRGFASTFAWDIPLLDSYDYRFVENVSSDPGTHHFRGLDNPTLIDELADWQPDAILLFGYNSASQLRVVTSRRLRNVPILFRGDSHLLARPPRLGKKILLSLLFRRFTACLSVGHANTDYFRQHGVASERIIFAPHGVDSQRFHPPSAALQQAATLWKSELRIPSHHRVILFAGKFEPKKRPHDLLRAFLATRLPDTTLLLAGGGPLERTLRSLASGHDNIRLAPFQNQSAMPRAYAAADLVVLPSCAPDETWGFVIQEAMSCGKPVIVSDQVGCHPDLLHHGRNGLVFPAGDQDALADSLREALADLTRLEQWGGESSKIVASYDYKSATSALARALAPVRRVS